MGQLRVIDNVVCTNPKLISHPHLVRIALVILSLLALSSISVAQDEAITDATLKQVTDTALAVASPAVRPATVATRNIDAFDRPNDNGGAVVLEWAAPVPGEGEAAPDGFLIFRAMSPDGPFKEVGDLTSSSSRFVDNNAENGLDYFYRVDAYLLHLTPNGDKLKITSASEVKGPFRSSVQYLNWDRFICLIAVLLISAAIIFFIRQAKKGQELYVRKIAGIDAVDEAVGRATEMGRKIFYVPGIQDMNDVQTIAGIAILGRVAEKACEYETWLEVPVCKSMVMVTARETMREAYTKLGRPDSFQDAQVHYLTDDQFGYAAAIDGMVVREKPATIFYMGAFFAESLILAETGNAAGAIQIAGTAMPSQLPFFVAACDYTLIGEELFAASAYLSREPRQLGSLKGQDFGKAIFLLLIIVGIISATVFGYDLSQYIMVR